MTDSLLSKWALDKGSLLSSSAVPDLLPSGQPRKRKTQSAASVRPAEGKKIKESDREHQLSLRSSLLLSGNAQSSLLLTTHGKSSSDASSSYKSLGATTRSAVKTPKDTSYSSRSLYGGNSLLSSRISLTSGLLSSSSPGLSILTARKTDIPGSSLLGSRLSSSLLTASGTTLKLGTTSLLKGQPGSAGPSHLYGGNYTAGSVSLHTQSTLVRSSNVGPKEGGDAEVVVRKIKGGKKSEVIKKAKKRTRSDRYAAPPPQYDLANEITATVEIVLPKFIPPEQDKSLLFIGVKLHDVNGLKFALVNAVSGSLICQPNFSLSTDSTRVTLVTMANKVICYDPEFVLKLALYTRKQLNIRTTGNFLLALASHIPACRPYLKKYYGASIGLPSDWIEVAEIYQAFPDKTLVAGSIPSALRRAMVGKFTDFDKYQLAKYNKDSSKKKKNKKAKEESTRGGVRGRGRGRGAPTRGAGTRRKGRSSSSCH